MLRKNFLLYIVLIFYGCTQSARPPQIECPQYMEPEFLIIYKEYSFIHPEDFAPKIKELEINLSKRLSHRESGIYHLRLGILLSHPKNPRPDYQKALKELDLYLSHVREEDKIILETFQKLLKEIVRLDKESAELKKKLELLKSLDLDIEKKRIKPR